MNENGTWVYPDDAPELTAEHFERADVYDGECLRRGTGRPPLPASDRKRLIDQDVLDAFRATGPGWQTRINDALRQAVPRPSIDAG